MIEGCNTFRLYLPCLPRPVPVPDHENVIRQTYPPLLGWIIETRGEHDVASIFNVSHRKVGGIHFFKIGRFCFMFCLSKPKELAVVATEAA